MLKSLDGTPLAADVLVPPQAASGAVLVHGGGVDRHEGGFFDRMADGLARAGIASIRLDLRGHGESDGRQEDLTLAAVANDVRAGIDALATLLVTDKISIVGASFSGGVCASVAARYASRIGRLILINPLLDYKWRFIEQKDYWNNDYISTAAAEKLANNGYIEHSPSFRLGAPLLNEVFWWDSRSELVQITAPTLIIHGTEDTFLPIESSRTAIQSLTCTSELMELEGAQHGIAVHNDPCYQNPQTQSWQAEAVSRIVTWLSA